MSAKTVYVPRFGSQLDSSQRGEPQMEQTDLSTCNGAQAQRAKRGNKRARCEKARSVLKVKLPGLSSHTKKVKNGDKTPRRWMSEPIVNESKTTVSREEETQCAGTDSDSVGGDVLFFSQRPNSIATTEKKKARLAVLRTISKMLEENQYIRQRLATLNQVNSGCTD